MSQQMQKINNQDEVEDLLKNYFKPGKLLYNWRQLFFINCFGQENQKKQHENEKFKEDSKTITLIFQNDPQPTRFTIELNKKIIVGSLKELQNHSICGENFKPNLCSFHFTFVFRKNMFGFVWAMCLKKKFGATEIKKKIARFVGFDSEIEMEDVSDKHYQSYIQILTNQKITMKQQKFCLADQIGEYQQFQIKQLTNQELQSLATQILIAKYIFILGTTHDILINEQLIRMLNEENEIHQINDDLNISFRELKEVYKNAILIKTNSSFIQFLLFSANSEPKQYGDFLDYDMEYKLEMQKFQKVLKIIKYENESWWIRDDRLNSEIKKNQQYFFQKSERIITVTPKCVESFEIQIGG